MVMVATSMENGMGMTLPAWVSVFPLLIETIIMSQVVMCRAQ